MRRFACILLLFPLTLTLEMSAQGDTCTIYGVQELSQAYHELLAAYEDIQNQLGVMSPQGRLYDSTGVVMPVGSIISWAGGSHEGGGSPPEGWLICAGQSIDTTAYPDLYAVIGNNWGAAATAETFKVPDLRGVFLRGMDMYDDFGDRGLDQDGRTAAGATSADPGSFQYDALEVHYHHAALNDYECYNQCDNSSEYIANHCNNGAKRDYRLKAGSGSSWVGRTSDNALGARSSVHETRPTNVYVNYIIKY